MLNVRAPPQGHRQGRHTARRPCCRFIWVASAGAARPCCGQPSARRAAASTSGPGRLTGVSDQHHRENVSKRAQTGRPRRIRRASPRRRPRPHGHPTHLFVGKVATAVACRARAQRRRRDERTARRSRPTRLPSRWGSMPRTAGTTSVITTAPNSPKMSLGSIAAQQY